MFHLLLGGMLSQYNIQHSKGFLGILWFLTPQGICNGLHGDFCSKTDLHFECLGVIGTAQPLSVTLIWTSMTIRACISIISVNKTRKHWLSDRAKLTEKEWREQARLNKAAAAAWIHKKNVYKPVRYYILKHNRELKLVARKGTNSEQALFTVISKILSKLGIISFMHPINHLSSNTLTINRAAIFISKGNLIV